MCVCVRVCVCVCLCVCLWVWVCACVCVRASMSEMLYLPEVSFVLCMRAHVLMALCSLVSCVRVGMYVCEPCASSNRAKASAGD